ncbi:hypothetical protein [Nostoc sp. FACHB-110]|uniref:hypothetical protein n=1 Tax=Nostoc sp. FACHB-110 TaxID=2692834 RepID=UPI001687FBAB|nr:hypothetical protein [Nostoc sp. FACHB-110]MBD2436600.1 hypothetical protein [Nostoc sp. FACHB-110]
MNFELSPANNIAHIHHWNLGEIHLWFCDFFATNHSSQLWCIGDILAINQLYQEVVHQ